MNQDNVVYFGRGKGHQLNPGNRKYREVINHNAAAYKSTSNKDEKNNIVKGIIQALQRWGASFVHVPKGNLGFHWQEMSQRCLVKKVKQSLRDSSSSSSTSTTSTSPPTATTTTSSSIPFFPTSYYSENTKVACVTPRTSTTSEAPTDAKTLEGDELCFSDDYLHSYDENSAATSTRRVLNHTVEETIEDASFGQNKRTYYRQFDDTAKYDMGFPTTDDMEIYDDMMKTSNMLVSAHNENYCYDDSTPIDCVSHGLMETDVDPSIDCAPKESVWSINDSDLRSTTMPQLPSSSLNTSMLMRAEQTGLTINSSMMTDENFQVTNPRSVLLMQASLGSFSVLERSSGNLGVKSKQDSTAGIICSNKSFDWL